jgi:hypothetical protein
VNRLASADPRDYYLCLTAARSCSASPASLLLKSRALASPSMTVLAQFNHPLTILGFGHLYVGAAVLYIIA